jgi:hypothetical protein
VKPKKHKGGNDPENLVVACHTCNSVKSSEDCSSVEKGREIIKTKNKVRLEWYKKHVLKDQNQET